MIDAVKANSTLNLPRSKRLVESRWSLEQIATISASHQQKEKIKKPIFLVCFWLPMHRTTSAVICFFYIQHLLFHYAL